MKIILLNIGKTDNKLINELIELYEKKLKLYIDFESIYLNTSKKYKKLSQLDQKKEESELIFNAINNDDICILLDEKGKEFNSVGFSEFIQKKMNQGPKRIVFIVGGPYGFTNEVYNKIPLTLAFSKMTFTHDMIRLFATEQIYRAFTILKGEPYHH